MKSAQFLVPNCAFYFYLHLQDVGNRVTLMTQLSHFLCTTFLFSIGNSLGMTWNLIWDSNLGPQFGTPIWDPDLGPQYGTPIWDPDFRPQFRTPIWNRDLGPRFGTPIWEFK
jgi:hypothetical protein